MKMFVFSLVALFVGSAHAGMGDFETPIACPTGGVERLMTDLKASAVGGDFAKSLDTFGKTLKNDFHKLLTDASYRSHSNAADIQLKISQAACMMELFTPESISKVASGDRYKDQHTLITSILQVNAQNSPLVAQTQAQKNADIAGALIGANRTKIALVMTVF